MATKKKTPRKASVPKGLEHDQWFYRNGAAKLFKKGETVPDDYKDSP